MFKEGDKVKCLWKGDKQMYDAKITHVLENGKYVYFSTGDLLIDFQKCPTLGGGGGLNS